MPSSAYRTVSGLVKDNIHHLDSAAETCDYIDDVYDLPPAFCTVADTFQFAQKFLRSTKTSIEGGSRAEDELYKAMSPVLTHCKEAAIKLDALLRVVITSESEHSTPTLERYRKAASMQGFKCGRGLREIDMRDLERALDEVSRIPPSLSNTDASQHRFINHGSGTMNVNTGSGPQNNNNNNNNSNGIQLCGGSVQSLYASPGPLPRGGHDEKPKPENGTM